MSFGQALAKLVLLVAGLGLTLLYGLDILGPTSYRQTVEQRVNFSAGGVEDPHGRPYVRLLVTFVISSRYDLVAGLPLDVSISHLEVRGSEEDFDQFDRADVSLRFVATRDYEVTKDVRVSMAEDGKELSFQLPRAEKEFGFLVDAVFRMPDVPSEHGSPPSSTTSLVFNTSGPRALLALVHMVEARNTGWRGVNILRGVTPPLFEIAPGHIRMQLLWTRIALIATMLFGTTGLILLVEPLWRSWTVVCSTLHAYVVRQRVKAQRR